METSNLFVLPRHSHTGRSFLSTQYTLRCCNRDYRKESGLYRDELLAPEFDCNKDASKVAPLLSFDNTQGHWFNNATRVFPPASYDGMKALINSIKLYMEKTSKNSRLWDLDGTVPVRKADVIGGRRQYTSDFIYVSKLQIEDPYTPISVHSAVAYVESSQKRGKANSLYKFPSQSTVVTGPHGGLHDNTSVEMGFEEKDGTKDPQKRTYNPSYVGFYCAGHTAHSQDAGKSRRVCSYTRVRIPSITTLDFLLTTDGIPTEGDWIVYCMGLTCRTTCDGIWSIVYAIIEESKLYYANQFDKFKEPSKTCPPTYLIYEDAKVLYLSISPGVILRSMPDNSMIDWSMIYQQRQNAIIEYPPIPSNGNESIQYKYSPFFMMTPFVEHDRPPRTLFASGQTTQGIFFPWSPATARVSPLHASKPIVATEFVRKIEEDQDDNNEALWDIFPGEDMVVCYMNLPLNYDDSMVVSSKFADMGGFSTLSLCTYRISESEEIPEVGEKLCGKKYKWWKVDCVPNCICRPKHVSPKTSETKKVHAVSTSARIPSGTVHEVKRTEDGHLSIKVLSFSQIITGDKISTMHGQKGVVRIVPQEDLPTLIMKNGSSMTADIYIAVGSVVSRQTNGQIYESACGLQGAHDGQSQTVGDVIDPTSEECEYIIHPVTGHIIMRELPSGIVEPVRATIGITRIINQTQMTRERHHLTHRPETKYSTGTKAGRADGGGVALSEMDFHAMFSSGLYSCAQELTNRGNMCLIPVCRNCNAIKPLHDCGMEDNMAIVTMPYDSAVFDQISAAVNNSCNRYFIEHA